MVDKDLQKVVAPSDPVAGGLPPELEAKKKEEEEKAAAEAAELEAKRKQEEEKAAAEAAKNVSKDDLQKYAYLTKLLNITNPDLTPAEVIKYDEIIQHTGFTPDLLLEIIKDPSCKENYFVKGGEKIQILSDAELLIISKALSKKISKEISSYTEKDWDAEVRELLLKYGVNLTDLKSGVKKIAEKVIDPKTEKVDKEALDKIVKGFEKLCLK